VKNINVILTLITIATVLTFAIFAFVIFNKNKFNSATVKEESEAIFVCGTSSYNGDAVINADSLATHGSKVFLANCKACHRIDKELVGPALRGVYARRDSIWLRQMIVNGEKLRKSGDKTAVALYKKYRHEKHIVFNSLSKKDVDGLMRYLKLL
jgi:hypothetical protein